MTIHARIEALPWDSAFFARRVAMLRLDRDAGALTREALGGFDLVQAKIAADDYASLDGLSEVGFQVVEAEVDLRAEVPAASSELVGVSGAEQSDIDALRAIAAEAFTTTRFRPPWFASGEGGRLYAQWVENAARGIFDHACLVSRERELRAGFITLRRLEGQEARVGLIAVAKGLEGRGTGKRLVQAAFDWSRRAGAGTLRVATQLGNLRALRLFEQSGFSSAVTSYWLYWQPR